MCEFCTQHGEGKKWYLAMENYSIELLDQSNRRKYAAEFLNGFHRRAHQSVQQLDKIRKSPLMKNCAAARTKRWLRMRKASRKCRPACRR